MIISELYTYPIKSMKPIVRREVRVEKRGLLNDRRWMVVTLNGRFLTQRTCSLMSQFWVEIIDGGIRIFNPHQQSLDVIVPTHDHADTLDVEIWGERCQALDAGCIASAWLTQYLDVECRLVYMPDDFLRPVDQEVGSKEDIVSFADGFPLLLTSQASLLKLNHSAPKSIESLRFRPNIVISDAEPFEEDYWLKLKIDEVVFDVVKPCSRCVIPSINLDTGEKEPEIYQFLRAQRSFGKKIYFGQNLIPRTFGVIRVGDTIEVIKKSPTTNIPD